MTRLCCVRPALTVLLGFAFAALGLGYAAYSLTLETSKFDLLPAHQRYATLYKDYSKDFGQLEDIVVVIESPAADTSKAYAASLAGALGQGALATARISYRIEGSGLDGRGLVYLPPDTLHEILETIAGQEELLGGFATTPTLDRLVDGINQYVGATFLPAVFGPGTDEVAVRAPTGLLRDLLAGISARIDGEAYRSPWASLFAGHALGRATDGYFFSDDGRMLYVVIDLAGGPRTGAAEQGAIDAIRRAIAALRPQFPSVQVGVVGAPALFTDELNAAAQDSHTASILAFVATLGLLLVAFRRLMSSCAMLAVLALSLGWSMGVITLTVGHLTIFSVMFVSVVVGIGIDYGIYFLFRYREECALGRSLTDAVARTAARSGPGILLGGLTAAVTFYILALSDFRGIRDFGFISGTAILLACLAMLTVFPAVLLLIDRWHSVPRLVLIGGRAGARRSRGTRPTEHRQFTVPTLEWLMRYPKTIIAAAVLVTAASLWAAPGVGFDYNLLNLQAKDSESVVWERKIAAAAGRSGFAALATATSLAELDTKQEAFRRLPSVAEVHSVISLLPDRQAEKLQVLERIAAVADSIHVGRPGPLDVQALSAALETLQRRLDLAARSGGDGKRGEVLAIHQETSGLLQRLTVRDRQTVAIALTDFQARLADDFAQQWQRLQLAARPAPVTVSDLPAELRRKFIGTSGRFLLQVYSRLDIWERPGATQFVEELRTVDPDVTGQPVVVYESMRLVETAYRQGMAYAFLLVGGIAVLMIRRLRETAIAMVPLVIGTLWTIGIMQLAGLKFNLVNVWALPLIIGSAAEYGVNIVLRILEARKHGGPRLARSTVMGVTFNGLTTMAGFGCLLVARHHGVWSLGLLLVIGSVATLVASLVVLPALARLVGERALAPTEGGETSRPQAIASLAR